MSKARLYTNKSVPTAAELGRLGTVQLGEHRVAVEAKPK
jgi:hypothetical protein